MRQKRIDEILRLHRLWLEGDVRGKCADFNNVDLSKVRLLEANLRRADLDFTVFRRADLRGVDFRHAFLNKADLSYAYCVGADFRYAYLAGARLHNTYLHNCIGDGVFIKSAQLVRSKLVYTKYDLFIGAVGGTIESWREWEPLPEDPDARFWYEHRDIVFQIIDTFPAGQRQKGGK